MTGPTQTPGDPNHDQSGQVPNEHQSAPDYGQAPPPPSYDQPVYGQPDYGQAPPSHGQPPSYGQTPPAYGQQEQAAYGQQPGYQQPGTFPPPPGSGNFPPPPGAPPAGYTAAAPGYAQPATVGIRLGARLIDGLIVGIPFWIVLQIIAAAAISGGSGFWFVWLLEVIGGPLLITSYYAALESNSGQTLGHKWLGMRTAQYGTGQLLTFNDSFKRNIVLYIPIVSFIMFIIAAVTINGDPEQRGFHDKLANSQVLKIS